MNYFSLKEENVSLPQADYHVLIPAIYVNSAVSAVRLAVFKLNKTTEIISVENFQEVTKVDDENEDKTVKSICDPKVASRKWTSTTKLNTTRR